MCLGDGGRRAQQLEAEKQRADEEARQGRVREGADKINQTFAGYDDDFYKGITQNYLDYATPQVEDQFKDAARQLRITLARNSMLNSSVNVDRKAKLQEDFNNAMREQSIKGKQFANATQQNLEAAKTDLLSQNQNIADPILIAQSAANRANAAAELPPYSPLGDLFAGAAEGFATQLQLEQRKKNRYTRPELFNFGGSSKVVE